MEGSRALESNASVLVIVIWSLIFHIIYVKLIFPHVFMYAFITLFIISANNRLNAYYIPDSTLSTMDELVNKTVSMSAGMELIVYGGDS